MTLLLEIGLCYHKFWYFHNLLIVLIKLVKSSLLFFFFYLSCLFIYSFTYLVFTSIWIVILYKDQNQSHLSLESTIHSKSADNNSYGNLFSNYIWFLYNKYHFYWWNHHCHQWCCYYSYYGLSLLVSLMPLCYCYYYSSFTI